MYNQIEAKRPLFERDLSLESTSAIKAAQYYFLGIQHPEGYWGGELEGDTILESEYIFTRYFLGLKDAERFRKVGNYIRSQALPGGGWSMYPGGPAEVSVSAKAYFALK